MSTTRHLAAFAGVPPEVQAFWRLWFGNVAAPGKIQVDGLTTLMGSNSPDKDEETLAAGYWHLHGSGYCSVNDVAFFSERRNFGEGKYRVVRINPDDLTDHSYDEQTDGFDAEALCCTGGKVYVLWTKTSAQSNLWLSVYDASEDPIGTPTKYEIDDAGFGYGQSIDTDGTNLFIGAGKYLYRVPISRLTTGPDPEYWTHRTYITDGSGGIHCLAYDSVGDYILVSKQEAQTGHGPYIVRVDAADFTNKSVQNLMLGPASTDDCTIAGGKFWIGLEGPADTPTDGLGRIVWIQVTDLSNYGAVQVNSEKASSCYGVFAEPDGDYVWAVFNTTPGMLTRVKVSDTSDQQQVWLADGEDSVNELVFCGSKDKMLVAIWETPPVIVRLSYLTVDTDDPVICSTTQCSFWHPIRLYLEAAADVDTMKVWADGGNGLGSNITIMGNIADRYQEPSQSELTTGNYTGLDANGEDIFDEWTSGAKMSIEGSASAKGDVGTAETDNCFLVVQMKFTSACPAGDTPTEDLTLTHEDFGREQEKTATLMGDVTAVLGVSAIASGEAFGTLVTELYLQPGGVASLEAHGQPLLDYRLEPSAMASAEGWGTPLIETWLHPSSIASLEAFGTTLITLYLLPSAIASLEAFGSPHLEKWLRPSGVVSAEAFGTLLLQLYLLPDGVYSRESFGAPRQIMTLLLSGIASAEALGTPFLGGILTPTGIASLEAFGDHSVALAQTLVPDAIASLEAFGSHYVLLAQALLPDGVASAEAFGTATLGLYLLPGGVATAEAFGLGVLNLTMLPSGIASLEAHGTPYLELAAGPKTLIPGSIASLEAFGSHRLNLTVLLSGIASLEEFGMSVLTLYLLPSGIASLEAPGTPNTVLVLGVSSIATGEVLGIPCIIGGTTRFLAGVVPGRAFAKGPSRPIPGGVVVPGGLVIGGARGPVIPKGAGHVTQES